MTTRFANTAKKSQEPRFLASLNREALTSGGRKELPMWVILIFRQSPKNNYVVLHNLLKKLHSDNSVHII